MKLGGSTKVGAMLRPNIDAFSTKLQGHQQEE